jgi:hypothetical protein
VPAKEQQPNLYHIYRRRLPGTPSSLPPPTPPLLPPNVAAARCPLVSVSLCVRRHLSESNPNRRRHLYYPVNSKLELLPPPPSLQILLSHHLHLHLLKHASTVASRPLGPLPCPPRPSYHLHILHHGPGTSSSSMTCALSHTNRWPPSR